MNASSLPLISNKTCKDSTLRSLRLSILQWEKERIDRVSFTSPIRKDTVVCEGSYDYLVNTRTTE